MKIYQGKSVYHGIAVGKLRILKKEKRNVVRSHVEDVEAEIRRKAAAVDETMQQLRQLYDKALQEVGESGAAIFDVHQMMLKDQDYHESIENMIRTQ